MQDKNVTKLTDQDAALLEQGASMLEGLESDERNRGNCSTAEGAACSTHAVRRLASALLAHERAPSQCLHQILEPAPVQFDAGISGNKTPQAAPAAVAVPDGWKLVPTEPTPQMCHFGRYGGDKDTPAYGEKPVEGETAWPFVADHTAEQIYRAMLAAAPALAATPAEPFMWAIQGPDGLAYLDEGCVNSSKDELQAEVDGLNSPLEPDEGLYQIVPVFLSAPIAVAPVVLPEPVATIYTMEALAPGGSVKYHAQVNKAQPAGTKLFSEPQVRALLAQKLAIMPKGESAAAQLRAMATNYPAGHSWDKLDAKACIRGALEIEALRALLATATGLPAQAYKDSTPQLHVGDISFEGWYAGYVKEGTVSLKQNCRDAYAAGMGDPLVVAAPQAQADARDAALAATEQDALRLVRQTVRDFHYALDNRKHGGVAAGAAMNAIELALNMYWQQGQEADRRAAIAAAKEE